MEQGTLLGKPSYHDEDGNPLTRAQLKERYVKNP